MTLTDQSPMPIGNVHRGKAMENVPAEYLLKYWDEWGLWDRSKIYSEEYLAVHEYIKENFSGLETECPDRIVNHRPSGAAVKRVLARQALKGDKHKVRAGLQCPHCGCKAEAGICQNYGCESAREGGLVKSRKRNAQRVNNMRRYDRGSFLTKSRTRAGDHVVDIEDMTCTCEGFQNYSTCDHLRTALLRKTNLETELKRRARNPVTISLV